MVIPLPRAWLLTSALLLGCVAGQIAALAAKLSVDATIRPDLVVALVIGVPSVIGMLLVLLSGRRWITTVGAFVLAMGPGWLSVLLLLQVVAGD
jgi:hypothetical protein